MSYESVEEQQCRTAGQTDPTPKIFRLRRMKYTSNVEIDHILLLV